MPLSEKLDKGFESLVDTLFGSGQQEYYKGGLMRSRIGANDALTRQRGLQSRDLDTAYGERQSLLAELLAQSQQQGAGPEARMKYNALRSGKRMTDYTTAGINTADFASKLKAMEAMKTAVGPEGNPLFDQRTLLGLQAGQSGSDASLMSQRLATTPHRVQGLSDANTLATQLGQEKLGEQGFKHQQAGIEFREAMDKASTTQQKMDIIQTTFEKFGSSMEKAEQIPSGIKGKDGQGNPVELSLADIIRLQGGPTSGKPSAAGMKLGFTGGDVKELAEQKVLKIKEQIKNLGLTGQLKQQEINSIGKHWDPSGSVKMQTILRTVLDLKDRKHPTPDGRKDWEKLTWAQQEALIKAEVDRLYRNAQLTEPTDVGSALDQSGAPAGDVAVDYKSKLNQHFNKP